MKNSLVKKIFYLAVFFSCIVPAFSLKHVVQSGDTLYSISRKYQVSVSDIASANNIPTNYGVKIGQTLEIPSNEKPDQYIVQKGDTLYSISKKFGVNVDTLTILNKMSGTDIKVGQVINVPMAAVASTKPASPAKSPEQKKAVSVPPEKNEELVDLQMSDSRTYDNKKTASKNVKWPVRPKEIKYVTGKVSGVAITAEANEKVKTIHKGSVMFCGVYRGFGNVVFVQDENGFMYVYSNLAKIEVSEGDSVSYNQTLGAVAVDSRTNKPQLILMVFKNGNPIDPEKAPRG